MTTHTINVNIEMEPSFIHAYNIDAVEEAIRFSIARLLDTKFPPRDVPNVLRRVADALDAAWTKQPPDKILFLGDWDADEEDQGKYEFFNEEAASEEESRPSEQTRQIIAFVEDQLHEAVSSEQPHKPHAFSPPCLPQFNNEYNKRDWQERECERIERKIRSDKVFRRIYAYQVKASRAGKNIDLIEALSLNLSLLNGLRDVDALCRNINSETSCTALIFQNQAVRSDDDYSFAQVNLGNLLYPVTALQKCLRLLAFVPQCKEAISWLEKTIFKIDNARTVPGMQEMFSTARKRSNVFIRASTIVSESPGTIQAEVRSRLNVSGSFLGLILKDAVTVKAIHREKLGQGWALSMPPQPSDLWITMKKQVGIS